MNRRDFLKLAAVTGTGFALSRIPLVGGAGAADAAVRPAGAAPELVAVRNGEPGAMFDRGIAALGGMARFVKKGQTVLVKPNASPGRSPEYGSDTNPALVARIVGHCLDAGAAKVYVTDNTFTWGNTAWLKNFEDTGIGPAATGAGAVLAPANHERYYHEVAVDGVTLKTVRVNAVVLESDVLINVPVLKHHGGAEMSAAVKNLMGLVWDRRFYHRHGLHQCIADFLRFRKPDLTVVDAYRVLTGNGPQGGDLRDVRLVKMQFLSTDAVAADAAGARLMGRDPFDIGYLRLADAMGLGRGDTEKFAVTRITL